jgi:hypothetical protein
MKLLGLIAASVALALSGASAAQSNSGSDSWEFGITPYVWLPSIDGTLNFDVPEGGDSPVVNLGSNWLSNLKLAGMLTGTARKGEWGVFYDFVYVNIGQLRSTARDVNGPGGIISLPTAASLDSGIEGTVATLTATHTLVNSGQWQLDLIGGARYGNVSTSATWSLAGPIGPLNREGSVSKSVDFLDGIVGVRGHMQLGDGGRWYLPFELDIGAGTRSSTTGNGVLGIGYRFGWGDAVLAYRYLYCNLGGDQALHDVSLAGPALGVSFRW